GRFKPKPQHNEKRPAPARTGLFSSASGPSTHHTARQFIDADDVHDSSTLPKAASSSVWMNCALSMLPSCIVASGSAYKVNTYVCGSGGAPSPVGPSVGHGPRYPLLITFAPMISGALARS